MMGVGKDFSLNRCILFNVVSTAYLGVVLALLWIPFLIMVFLYVHIFTIVRRHTIAIVKHDYTRTLKQRNSTADSIPLKYTKTVCLVTGVYLVCWMPSGKKEGRKEMFYLTAHSTHFSYGFIYGVRHIVKDHSDSEKGNPLPTHRLLFPISSKGSFMCTIPQTG